MIDSLEKYRQHQQSILARLGEVATLLERFGMPIAELEEARARLADGTFLVVVAGEFSRGKSTFLNALLGARVLPMHALPTTATINEIRYGETPVTRVHYRDGHVEDRPVDTLKGFAIARKEDGRADAVNVDVVRIDYPCEYCRNGVVLVDTPGLNDPELRRQEITTEYIPRADAVIVVLDSNQVMSESEREFLTHRILGQNIRKLFVVVNKADLPAPDELTAVLRRAEGELAAIPGLVPLPEVYPVDAKPTLQAKQEGLPTSDWFARFEADLQRFLVEEKGTLLLRNATERGIRRLEDLAVNFAKRERAMAFSLQQLLEKERKFQSVIAGIRAKQSVLLKEIEVALVRAGLEQEEQVSRMVREAVEQSRTAVMESSLSAKDVVNYANQTLQNLLTEMLSERVVPKLQERVADLTSTANRQLRDMAADVDCFQVDELGFDPATLASRTSGLDAIGTGSGSLFEWGGIVGLGFWISTILTGPFGLILGGLASFVAADLLADWRAGKVKSEVSAKLDRMAPRIAEQVAGAVQRHMEAIRIALAAEASRRVDRLVADNQSVLTGVLQQKQAEEGEQAVRKAAMAEARRKSEQVREAMAATLQMTGGDAQ